LIRKVFFMLKNKLRTIGNFLVKHSKIAFPVIVIAAVAVTVTLALNAGNSREVEPEETLAVATEESTEVVLEPVSKEVPLVLNEDSTITTLITTFYNGLALGDSESLLAVCDEIPEDDLLYFMEAANYIESYPMIEIYSKPGPEEGSTIAYVYYKVAFMNQPEPLPGYKAYYICTNEQGERYIRFGENSEEVNEYIKNVSEQDDVVEVNTRIDVEYQQLMETYPEVKVYMNELQAQIRTSVGVALAAQQAEQEAQIAQTQEPVAESNEATEETAHEPEEAPVEAVPQYATATTTVNVRSSDSEQADKLGKVSSGTKLQIVEIRVNGWTKVLYEGKEGFIKSEYLQLVESAAGVEVIGTVTATTNINVRAAASESADRLGVLAGGDSVELVANENGWCKIKYNGQIGYVKADYVQQ